MAEIIPFVATRYAGVASDELGKLLTPPYDVIDGAMQQAFYDAHPHNIIRVDFGKKLAGDDDYENRYTRGEAVWKQWKQEGILAEDHQKAYYVYEQEFTFPGTEQRARRRGFFAAVRLQNFSEGGIRAHEQTFDGPKADRFRLMRSTSCNFSPIFCIYDDPSRGVDELIETGIKGQKPVETEFDGMIHRLWTITKSPLTQAMGKAMQQHTLFIADGHHRYETSLLYRDEMRASLARQNGVQSWDYTLMFLANTHDEGLTILPTHRVLCREACIGVDLAETLKDLEEDFEIETIAAEHKSLAEEAVHLTSVLAESGARAPSFVMIRPKGTTHLLRLRENADLDAMIDNDQIPSEIKRLDVTILHEYIINRQVLGNPEIELDDQDVLYIKDAVLAVEKMKCCKHGVGFLMNPTRIDQVTAVARLGLRMPHKSTYFYPKLCTGLVMRDLNSPF